MIRLVIAIGLAISLAGCPLRPSGTTSATQANTPPGEGTSERSSGTDALGEACSSLAEAAQCNGADEDCDGRIDEGCSFYLGGHLSGAGLVSAQDGFQNLAGGPATHHVIGRSSDGAWVIQAGLPSPQGGP